MSKYTQSDVAAVAAECAVAIDDGTGTLRAVVEAALADGSIDMEMSETQRVRIVRGIWDDATEYAAAEAAGETSHPPKM